MWRAFARSSFHMMKQTEVDKDGEEEHRLAIKSNGRSSEVDSFNQDRNAPKKVQRDDDQKHRQTMVRSTGEVQADRLDQMPGVASLAPNQRQLFTECAPREARQPGQVAVEMDGSIGDKLFDDNVKDKKPLSKRLQELVLDPSGLFSYYWSFVVSLAFLYNFWSLSYRFAFQEINYETMPFWFTLDYSADLIYLLDIVLNFHTGYLEDGVLQKDIGRISLYYREQTLFYLDGLCLLPLDILYLSIGFNSILRCTRLVKIYKFWSYVDHTERHTNYPNVFRTFTLVHYILVIFHWNACLIHMISKNKLLDIENLYKINDNHCDDIPCQYLHAFYWSTLALTTIGDLPKPTTKGEYFYVIVELFFGLFIFASVLGHVANIVTNVSTARKEFQAKLDAVKTYMRVRRVSDDLQNKVISWFNYLWSSQKSSVEDNATACLPDRLKAEIAIHVHLDTLMRVDVFQNTEVGFLCELVLRLKPVLYSPGDYVCREDEIGREMYIVSRGVLEVVAKNGQQVVATLKAGSYFGEISVLNLGQAGNKRTASVRSVGYSDLFCLFKQDLWDVLKNYPQTEARIRARAEERLRKLKGATKPSPSPGQSEASQPPNSHINTHTCRCEEIVACSCANTACWRGSFHRAAKRHLRCRACKVGRIPCRHHHCNLGLVSTQGRGEGEDCPSALTDEGAGRLKSCAGSFADRNKSRDQADTPGKSRLESQADKARGCQEAATRSGSSASGATTATEHPSLSGDNRTKFVNPDPDPQSSRSSKDSDFSDGNREALVKATLTESGSAPRKTVPDGAGRQSLSEAESGRHLRHLASAEAICCTQGTSCSVSNLFGLTSAELGKAARASPNEACQKGFEASCSSETTSASAISGRNHLRHLQRLKRMHRHSSSSSASCHHDQSCCERGGQLSVDLARASRRKQHDYSQRPIAADQALQLRHQQQQQPIYLLTPTPLSYHQLTGPIACMQMPGPPSPVPDTSHSSDALRWTNPTPRDQLRPLSYRSEREGLGVSSQLCSDRQGTKIALATTNSSADHQAEQQQRAQPSGNETSAILERAHS